MLPLVVLDKEFLNNETMEFFTIKGAKLSLEHSLISISKWEAQYKKPFPLLNEIPMTIAETRDYIRHMTLTQNVNPSVYRILSNDNIAEVQKYIDDPMTATSFSSKQYKKPNQKIVTSEEIYYWMISLGIPFECEKWHINRLLTLVRICEEKNKPRKKMSKADVYKKYDELNELRKARLGTSG